MTLQTSGNISLTDLQGEFGGAAPLKLTDYYAGGGLVPAGATDGSGNPIPSSGTIKLTDFYGAANVGITLSDHTVWRGITGSSVTAVFTLYSDGLAQGIGTSIVDYTPEWASNQPNTVGSDYECKATQVSGDAVSGDTLGTWLSLLGSRSWSLSANAPAGTTDSKSGVIFVEIRRAGTTQVLASANITIQATAENL